MSDILANVKFKENHKHITKFNFDQRVKHRLGNNVGTIISMQLHSKGLTDYQIFFSDDSTKWINEEFLVPK